MKRTLFAVITALILVAALAGCGSPAPTSPGRTTTTLPSSYFIPDPPPEIPTIEMPDLKTEKTYTVSYTTALVYNNHVGDAWGTGVFCGSDRISNGQSITVTSYGGLSLKATAVEVDSCNDVGSKTVGFAPEIGESETQTVDVVVREDRGRFAGNTACWRFTITVYRSA